MDLRLVAGFDAGGSRTVCRIASLKGEMLAEGLAGPGNHRAIGVAAAAQALEQSYRQAISRVGPPSRIEAAFIAASGFEPGDAPDSAAALWQGWLQVPMVRVDTDVLATWAVAHALRPGAVVVAGTGSVVLVVDASGRRRMAGGWGHLLGDEGSAYDVGRQALTHLLAVIEGRASAGRVDRLLAARLVPDLRASATSERGKPGRVDWKKVRRPLIDWVYEDAGSAKTRIASLAPVISHAAQEGDPLARSILDRAARRLASSLAGALGPAFLPSLAEVGLAGGMFESPVFLHRFERAVRRHVGHVSLRKLDGPPVEGAVLLARGLAGAVTLPPRLFA